LHEDRAQQRRRQKPRAEKKRKVPCAIVSIRRGSVFERSRLPIATVLSAVFLWSQHAPQDNTSYTSDIAERTNVDREMIIWEICANCMQRQGAEYGSCAYAIEARSSAPFAVRSQGAIVLCNRERMVSLSRAVDFLNALKRSIFFGVNEKNSSDPKALTDALHAALDAGYRLIDTAYVYGNEAVIGKVLQEYFTAGKLKRSDVFITSKVGLLFMLLSSFITDNFPHAQGKSLFYEIMTSNYARACMVLPYLAHSPNEIEAMLSGQLKDLQTDYLDLYLIHVPCPCKHQPGNKHGDYHALIENNQLVPDPIDHLETWKVLEKLHKEGKAIGVSNFNEEQIQHLLDNATVKPHNLQRSLFEVEAHIYWPQNELYEFCKKNSITMTAYGPLGSPGRKAFRPDGTWPEGEPLKDPVVLELAKKHNKTPAQVSCICSHMILLRQMVQRGISTIPKSTNVDRVRENFNIFDFELNDDEMNSLSNVKTRTRLFVFDFFAKHPFYPFKDVDKSKLKEVHLAEF
uniref:NADP-dependent oxidoreductase domain-containing protein n=1 Tax=Ascaris lumbricoides TaxID=6252 RepID=A0A9J2PDV8_ASCLU